MRVCRLLFAALCAVLLALAAWPSKVLAQFVHVNTSAIDQAVETAQQSWQVPGLSVGIVLGERIVYLKGFGVRTIGTKEAVTPDTSFALGSCSKPFTTLLLALLAEAGKLAWDDPVRRHLPNFRLADPLADANVTLRDLVTHRTGVDSHDLLWYRAAWTQEEAIAKLAFLQPSRSFRSKFQYQSLMFTAAGLAAGKAGGDTWQHQVQKRILDPLAMDHTTLTTADVLKQHDRAMPHHKTQADKIEALPWYEFREPNPAGSVNSTARDLCHFLKFQLAGGRWKGERLISEENLLETRSPQMIIPVKGTTRQLNPHTMQISYGMGWVVQDYRGQLMNLHGGAIDGFRAQMTMLPRYELGIVVLSNMQGSPLNIALTNSLIDLLLGAPPYNWNAHLHAITKAGETAHKEEVAEHLAQRHTNTKPSRELQAYTGVYQEPAYGEVRVTLKNGQLMWHWSTFDARLEHFHFDTFEAIHPHLVDAQVVFTLGADGEVASMQALERTFTKVR